jgi:hypothetical protein
VIVEKPCHSILIDAEYSTVKTETAKKNTAFLSQLMGWLVQLHMHQFHSLWYASLAKPAQVERSNKPGRETMSSFSPSLRLLSQRDGNQSTACVFVHCSFAALVVKLL